MATAFDKQIANRNFLSPIGFKFTLAKYPKVDFFSQSANIPEISLGEKITYGDFRLSFIVDENMENYTAIHKWITGLGFPETTQQYKTQITNVDGQQDINEGFSDGTLHILNSNFNDTIRVKFQDLFPVSLGSLEFQANEGDYNYFTAEVLFKYTVYNFLDTLGKPL
jgi:hypothetical protein